MQNLPLGIQDFEELISNKLLYIDKTQLIYQLLENKYYFLSRPRRFGKSLLISTLRDIFLGKKELFEGLWIEDKITWEKHPVIHLSFGKADFKEIGLRSSIFQKLQEIADEYDLKLTGESIANQFRHLILTLSQEKNVVILIDEYDKPIVEYLGKTEIPQAIENRSILKTLYSVFKDLDRHIRFLFITGVSKFAKVSIFSDLNNLSDISMVQDYATLLGYTQVEVEQYFKARIHIIAQEMNIKQEELLKNIKQWYNGYQFAPNNPTRVYNPFSVLSFMQHREFANYWFSTGTPTFLTKKLKEENFYQLDELEIDEEGLGKSELERMDIVSLLYQTGYLTIQEKVAFDIYALDYPNQEVRNSMLRFLLVEYSQHSDSQTKPLVSKIQRAFAKNDIALVFEYLNTLFAKIPYQIFEDNKESYYHSIIFLAFTILGYYTTAEVQTSRGRIDAVVETDNNIYILEFKVNDSAENALKQIKERKYYQKYKNSNKVIYLIGTTFQDKELKEYLIEKL